MFHVPEKYRVKIGALGSTAAYGNKGCFLIATAKGTIIVIAYDGAGWEHVSVSLATRCPTWDEMCLVKDMFWDDTDCAVQYHPPKSEYVNFHPFCLHIWRPIGIIIPTPPSIMVGPK